MKILKENALLLVAALVPCLVIGYFVASATIPRLLTESPTYSFLYAEERYRGDRRLENRLYIRNGKLHAEYRYRNDKEYHGGYHHAVRLHLYDTKRGELREIPLLEQHPPNQGDGKWHRYELPELKNLRLDSTRKSPDGFTVEVVPWRSRGIFQELFVGSRRSGGLHLAKNGLSAAVVDSRRYYSTNNFRFLGWIINDGDSK